eukprot:gene9104-9273_t
MARASHTSSRRNQSTIQKVDGDYFVRILSTVTQEAAKFSDFVLQPDDFQQIHDELAEGAAVMVWRGDPSVFKALVSATAHGYFLAEGWEWQGSNSISQQAVMLLSRMSFCLKFSLASVHGEAEALDSLSDSDRDKLKTMLSGVVLETGLIDRLERARNVTEAWTAADSNDQRQQQQPPGKRSKQEKNLLALEKSGILDLSASNLDASIHMVLLVYLAMVTKAIHEQQKGRPVSLKMPDGRPFVTQQQKRQQKVPAYHDRLLKVLNVPPNVVLTLSADDKDAQFGTAVLGVAQHLLDLPQLQQLQWPTVHSSKGQHQQDDADNGCAAYELLVPILLTVKELVLLQPGLGTFTASLPACCEVIERNISEACPEKVVKQLLQDVLPVLVERQLPVFLQVYESDVVRGAVPVGAPHDWTLVICGAEVILLFKMGILITSYKSDSDNQCTAVVASNTRVHLLLLAYLALLAKALHEQQDGQPFSVKPSCNAPYIKQEQQQKVPAYHERLLQLLDVPPKVVLALPDDDEVFSMAVDGVSQHLLNLPKLQQFDWPAGSSGKLHLQQHNTECCAAYELLVPILLTVKELVLLQPGLGSVLTSLHASCCLMERNASSVCPEAVTKQLLQELLPVLVERQLPIISHMHQESAGASVVPDERGDVLLVGAGTEVLMLFKMGMFTGDCFEVAFHLATAFESYAETVAPLLEAHARPAHRHRQLTAQQAAGVALVVLKMAATKPTAAGGSTDFLQDRQERNFLQTPLRPP